MLSYIRLGFDCLGNGLRSTNSEKCQDQNIQICQRNKINEFYKVISSINFTLIICNQKQVKRF